VSFAEGFHGLSGSGGDGRRLVVVSPLWEMPEDGGVVGNGEGCQAKYNSISRGDSKRGRGRDVVGFSEFLDLGSKMNKGRGCLEFLWVAPQG
jgi:hypothetical protein